ncbi:MAG: sulfite exporter TauE/SafE family protein [Chitinophagaceae bacterium]
MEVIVAILIFVSFLVSASCGMGGSLILIPALTLLFGIKESIIISSILLGLNNLVKVIFFRQYIRFRPILWIMLFIFAGAGIGAVLLLSINEKVVAVILLVHVIFSFFFQRNQHYEIRKKISWLIAFTAGLFSGIAGTSGPLKGIALKCNVFEKLELVAAASIISLVSDSTKSIIYLTRYSPEKFPTEILLFSIIVMPIATGLGKKLNQRLSQTAYDALFYCVLSGYVVRLFL